MKIRAFRQLDKNPSASVRPYFISHGYNENDRNLFPILICQIRLCRTFPLVQYFRVHESNLLSYRALKIICIFRLCSFCSYEAAPWKCKIFRKLIKIYIWYRELIFAPRRRSVSSIYVYSPTLQGRPIGKHFVTLLCAAPAVAETMSVAKTDQYCWFYIYNLVSLDQRYNGRQKKLIQNHWTFDQ